MNKFSINILRLFRKFYRSNLYNPNYLKNIYIKDKKFIKDKYLVNDQISKILLSNKPCFISRFGRNELNLVRNYLGIKKKKISYFKFISDQEPANWLEIPLLKKMSIESGFFHEDMKSVEKFSEIYLENLQHIDLLGVYMRSPHLENYFAKYIDKSKKVDIENLAPFFTKNPWTLALEGKKVLIIHPFSDLIVSQYKKRDNLFANKILPDFKLYTFAPINSVKGEKIIFNSWFEALESMKLSICKIDFDIALIACGAYGLPLGGYIKSLGKKAFHLGGPLQLLFGIIGERWIDYKYSKSGYQYNQLFNSHWVRPSNKDRPKNAKNIEHGAYW